MIPGSAGSSGGKLPPEETCAGHAQNTKQAMAHISQTRICVCRHFVAKCIWNRSGKYGLTNLYFATKGAIPPLLLSIQLVKCESQTAEYRLRTEPSTKSRCLGPTDPTFRVHQPQTFAGLQFSWHHRPRMPAVVWSCLAFATYRLTPAHPFLNVRVLEVGLLLTTRSCPLEADQPTAAWCSEPPG